MFIEPFDIEPFDIEPLLIEPVDALPLVMPFAWLVSFCILSCSPVDIDPLVIEPFDMLPDDVLLLPPVDMPLVADWAKAFPAKTMLAIAATIEPLNTDLMTYLAFSESRTIAVGASLT